MTAWLFRTNETQYLNCLTKGGVDGIVAVGVPACLKQRRVYVLPKLLNNFVVTNKIFIILCAGSKDMLSDKDESMFVPSAEIDVCSVAWWFGEDERWKIFKFFKLIFRW